MTEPELITALTNASVDARAVLAVLSQYANANGDVTLTLSSGASYTLPGIGKQRNQFAADYAAQKLAFTQDFGGAVTAQTVNRNTFGTITGIVTTFSTGYQLQHDYTRNSQGQIDTILVTVRDANGNTVATTTKTLTRTNGYLVSVS